jgi:signal transduction histidine kinase
VLLNVGRPARRLPRIRLTARLRIVTWIMLAVVVAGIGMTFGMRQVLLSKEDQQLGREVDHELIELHANYGRLQSTPDLQIRLSQSMDLLVDESESLGALVDGRLVVSRPGRTFDLAANPALVSRLVERSQGRNWLSMRDGGLHAGAHRVQAGPSAPHDVVFIAAGSVSDRREIRDPVQAAAEAGAVTLIALAIISWFVAGRILAPVRTITAATRRIGEHDLRRRIPVSGADELSALARTINQMLDRLESSFRSQREFLDDAGHELRTPLTVLQAQLEEASNNRANVTSERSDPGSDGDDAPAAMLPVSLMQAELNRMQRTVAEMLLLARAERPDFLRLQAVDVGELLDDVHRLVSAWEGHVWTRASCASVVVIADRERLTQALLQLAENASRYTPAGTEISFACSTRGQDVLLHVIDHGPGIPPEARRRVFERFYRLDPAGRQGSGLGLSIVQASAVAHHGEAVVSTTPGGGATITLRIPVDQPQEPPCPAS